MVKSKTGSAAIYLLVAVVGILLVIFPGVVPEITVTVLGIALLVSGVAAVVTYFLKDEHKGFDIFQCIGGVLFVAMSVIVFTQQDFVMSLLPILVGTVVALSGVVMSVRAIALRKVEHDEWRVRLILAILTICFGIFICADPFRLITLAVQLVGVVLAGNGVAGIWLSVKSLRNMENLNRLEDKTVIVEQGGTHEE